MNFFELIDEIARIVTNETLAKERSIYSLKYFVSILKEKFGATAEKITIENSKKKQISDLLYEMIFMFYDLEVVSFPTARILDPFTQPYGEPIRNAKQKRLRILFEQISALLKINFNKENLSIKSDICTEEEKKCIIDFLSKLNPDLVNQDKLCFSDFYPDYDGADEHWSLDLIIYKAENKFDEFDKIAQELGWMNSDGGWAVSAPPAVTELIAFNKAQDPKSMLKRAYIRYLVPGETFAPITETKEDILQNSISIIIDNIEGKNKSSRYTHSQSSKKLTLLKEIDHFITEKKPLNDNTFYIILNLCQSVCNIKRNPLGIWDSHSSKEFKDLISQSSLKLNGKPIEFSSKSLKSILSPKNQIQNNLQQFIEDELNLITNVTRLVGG